MAAFFDRRRFFASDFAFLLMTPPSRIESMAERAAGNEPAALRRLRLLSYPQHARATGLNGERMTLPRACRIESSDNVTRGGRFPCS